MTDESVSAAREKPTSDVPLPQRFRFLSIVVGLACAAGGGVAVFETENSVGSAALMALGVYFLVSGFVGHFPRLILMGNEIDPRVVREVQEEVQDAHKASGQAKLNSEDVVDGLADTRERVSLLEATVRQLADRLDGGTRSTEPGPIPAPTPGPGASIGVDPRLAELAQLYNETRWTMKSGAQRTQVMTEIVDKMISVSREVAAVDVASLLTHEDRGLRLAGVARLYAVPDPAYVDQLADATLAEDKPFNEYWGLLTLRKTLREDCKKLSGNLRRRLQDRLRELPAMSDRALVIRGILDDCP